MAADTDNTKTDQDPDPPLETGQAVPDLKPGKATNLPRTNLPRTNLPRTNLTQAEADAVLGSDEILQTLRAGRAAKDGASEMKLPESWILACIAIFLVYLVLIYFVE